MPTTVFNNAKYEILVYIAATHQKPHLLKILLNLPDHFINHPSNTLTDIPLSSLCGFASDEPLLFQASSLNICISFLYMKTPYRG